MRTRLGWLCPLVLMLALLPSMAYGGSSLSPGGLGVLWNLAMEEIADAPALGELLGEDPPGAGLGGPADRPLLAPPQVIPRDDWGADEALRFQGRRQRVSPSFSPVRKLIVHHTVTRRWEPPRRALRRIYRSHTISRGLADIAYHYVIAPDGRVFKGRYSGPAGTRRRDRAWADKRKGFAVRGAHALAANEGTLGVALLGNYEREPLPERARSALVRLLAWLSDRYGIDPLGSSRYPRWGGGMVLTRNLDGHRAYGPTACPGEAVQGELPGIRRDVAGLLRDAAQARPDAHGPLIHEVRIPKVGRRGAIVRWTTDEPSRTVVSVRAEGSTGRRTEVHGGLTTRHEARLRPLRRGTAYVLRIGGADADGNAAWSAPYSLRTKG